MSFILLGSIIMLNLFIGITMNSVEEMPSELDEYNAAKRGRDGKQGALGDLAALDEQVASLKNQLTALRGKLEKEIDRI
jgi:hypothetical protein